MSNNPNRNGPPAGGPPMGGPPMGGSGGGPGRNMARIPGQKLDKASLKRLLTYFVKYKFRLSIVVLCIITSALVNVAASLFIKSIIDDYITPMLLTNSTDYSALLKTILTMGGVFVFGAGSTLLYNLIMVYVAQAILKEVRDQMFEHMQKLPIRYFDGHSHGDIMSHYTNDADTLRQLITTSIPQMISSAITIVSVFFTMLYLNIYLTVFVLFFVFLMINVIKILGGKSGKFFVAQQKSLGALNGYIEEIVTGQKVVKVFCYEDKANERFNALNEELRQNACEANKNSMIIMPILGNLGSLQYILIAVVGATLAAYGVSGITVGTVSAFLQLSRSFTMPISQVSQQINLIITALAGAGRIFKLLDEEVEEDAGTVTLVNADISEREIRETKEKTGNWAWKTIEKDGKIKYTLLRGNVKFEDVDFSYVPEKTVLHNVSLYAKPGQKIAFVGSTGAGKTTITNLINRFYDIADGKITYDGISINDIKKSDLRRSLGIVLQDVNLFSGTVMDNIRYGRLDATDEECIAAAKLANAHGFITMLPNGYNTVLEGDASGLSQGQRQLISIARVAVADPPVMILDEATSSIDSRTESIVQKGMDALMRDRTVFVIAHRLSTVRNSNAIMVLENGHIIERGDHEELIAMHGKYHQLYTGALELE